MATESIILGGGCFWCIETCLRRLKGVSLAESGYTAGELVNPTYQQICTGETGHAEVVKVEFDNEIIGLETILDVFFALHDPTTLNRQGHDVGTQYRSIIVCETEQQMRAATDKIEELVASKQFSSPIVTQVVMLEVFYPAEAYHQDYYRSNPFQPYCQAVISPKLKKLFSTYDNLLAT